MKQQSKPDAVARLHNYAKPQLSKALAMVQATVGGKARLIASATRPAGA